MLDFYIAPQWLVIVNRHMAITWDEVRHRAIRFSKEWALTNSEAGEKQTFWNEFFEVFGIRRRSVATFEEPVQSIRGTYGRIDLFWRGKLLVEHKSAGEDLGLAKSQAFDYIASLTGSDRADEAPRYVVVSDFSRFILYDLEPEVQRDLPLFKGMRYSSVEFPLSDLYRNVRAFAFLRGEQILKLDPEDPANQKAYDLMCMLHDELHRGGFSGADLERMLVRILFCLFADDNGIFEPNAFQSYVEEFTRNDGSDLGAQLNQLFDVLNTPPDRRASGLGEVLASFPYVNGALFADRLGFPIFTSAMRDALLDATHFCWARISPAVFGSLFQGIMLPAERRQKGAHYTSERDIMKVLRSLFLDELIDEFNAISADTSTRKLSRLEDFHTKIRNLRFLDPACGCGNFLVLAYRELRLLELELLKLVHKDGQGILDIRTVVRLDVDQFYGIEISEWPARIAEVALWLMDHQMNQRVGVEFGQYFHRLPLRNSPHIACKNALLYEWSTFLPPTDNVRVFGNPPFVGKKARDASQQADMERIFGNFRGAGVLDYVCCWYALACKYIKGTNIPVGFVSTNSITQGEQPGILWSFIRQHFEVYIIFAHRTFNWTSEARGKAHVHVVIIGFSCYDRPTKLLYDYDIDKDSATISTVNIIGPYLIANHNIALQYRDKPVSAVPAIEFGNMPNDNGNLLLSDGEYKELIRTQPELKPLIRRFLSAHEYLHAIPRWCIWLNDKSLSQIKSSPELVRRIQAVQQYRASSSRKATQDLARIPYRFGEVRQSESPYVLIPRHSSEGRRYIPMSYYSPDYIVGDSCLFIADATSFHFGVLSSAMHMAWVKQVCGRIKSDYRYSNKLVYNNFPWPETTEQLKSRVSVAADAVISARANHADSSLADLYDPLAMPEDLLKAHLNLDRIVDQCYRRDPFPGDRQRVEHLFFIYQSRSTPLLPVTNVKLRRGKSAPKAPQPYKQPKSDNKEFADEADDTEVIEPQPWFSIAQDKLLAGLSDDGTDTIADNIESLISQQNFEQLNNDLKAIVNRGSTFPVDGLITVLTFTYRFSTQLPNRADVRCLTERRLLALGKNPAVLLSRL